MALRIYNTLTRTKEPFIPLHGKTVKMYTCGQTTYNDIHIGNARFYVVFDAVRRYLTHCGYDVQFVQNFTDIDDKLITRAAETGKPVEELADLYIARTREDLGNLNVLEATHNPRATHEIPAILTLIEKLLTQGAAYERNGTIFFDTSQATEYGKLSRKKPEDLLAGARVEIDTDKRNPADFVLWKPAKPGEPAWESPWGSGRPGWHIECSAMIQKYLGETIDIHGGAADLIFPHHENEIAQSETANSTPLARYWMHCGLLTVDHKKMSKSLGNFQTLREVAERFPHDVIRFYLLSGHYRMPMEFGDEMIAAAARGLERIKNCTLNLIHGFGNLNPFAELDYINEMRNLYPNLAKLEEKFYVSMNDDFNTADAITSIFEWVKTANIYLSEQNKHPQHLFVSMHWKLNEMCLLLGFNMPGIGGDSVEYDNLLYIEEQINQRQAARKARNFAEADRIRNELAEQGIILEDTPDGVRWKKA